MFIDSDFNGNSFGDFDTDNTLDNSNYSNASGEGTPNYIFADKYNVKPTKTQFADAGVNKCNTWLGSITCTWVLKIPQYGISSTVTDAFDTVAISKNSYGYNFSEMKENLSKVQEEVNSLVPFTSNMTCEQYVSVVSSLNETLSSWNGASVTHLYDRDLRAEYLSAIATALAQVSSFMDARDCNGATSAIDTAQDAADASSAAQIGAEADAQKAKALADKVKLKAKADADAMKAKNDLEILELQEVAAANLLAAEEEKAALDKRNKIIMFGAGLVILILIIKK